MNPNHELDRLLTGPDRDDLPTGDAFVRAVMTRVERRLRRRRVVLGATGGAVSLIVCAVLIVLPVPGMLGALAGPFDTVALLALAALCSLVWIASEDTSVLTACT